MIILTGGAGFIGSCFLKKLNEESITDIIVVDDLDESDKWRNLTSKKFIDYVQKDDFLDLIREGKISKPSSVVHMGACSSTTLSDSDHYIKNNYEYSKHLATWALQKKASFLYASSAATYGDGSCGYSDSEDNMGGLTPLNMYGYSKHMFDMWALNSGLIKKITGLKFFNVFGPNEYHKEDMRSVICKALPAVRDTGKMSLFKSYNEKYPNGGQMRDFIYIKDAADVMYHLFMHPEITGIYNLGTGKARTWEDLAKAIFAALGKTPKIEYIDMPETLREKYQYFTQADMTKLRNTGCPLKFRSLEESIKDYVGYLENRTYL
ncbi:MAG: ADP-glyceromanno-heptose 6-epimerase [Candidatus Aadella gelida]|nr:ADP-glyceromanno-heptose 6-epimerase [Candidatus Aadella gelida]